ncbi:MAG TPA: LemA family protein [Clostridia bacterium]
MFLASLSPIVITVIVLVAIILILLLYIIITVNSFKQLIVKISEADSGINVALTKRYDLLTKALDTAKAYTKYEKETLYEIIDLRKDMTTTQKAQVVEKLDKMGNTVNVLAENYPELRSAQVFSDLMSSIKDSEEHLQAARRLYNSNVSHYNQKLVSFPASIIAKMLNLKAANFFVADIEKKNDVKISL